jgi:imidazole glycerol-phosphate synthase subunit HisH
VIAVIDYKAGNLTSVIKAVDALGFKASVTADPEVVRKAERVLLPGVGHFQATQLLADTGLTTAIRDSISRGVPFLGICVGLQWLFEGSTEAPATSGLGLFSGQCERFAPVVKVPHVGWNQVRVNFQSGLQSGPQSRLMQGVEDGAFVYYTHSYRAPMVNETVAVTEYDGSFSGAVERGNVMGVQFHPEKSGTAGMRVLKNFLELAC